MCLLMPFIHVGTVVYQFVAYSHHHVILQLLCFIPIFVDIPGQHEETLGMQVSTVLWPAKVHVHADVHTYIHT